MDAFEVHRKLIGSYGYVTRDLGAAGAPFRRDPRRRLLLRCELDAALFHPYGVQRDDADHVMDTFPIVRCNGIAAHGEYRTKRAIPEVFGAQRRTTRTRRASNGSSMTCVIFQSTMLGNRRHARTAATRASSIPTTRPHTPSGLQTLCARTSSSSHAGSNNGSVRLPRMCSISPGGTYWDTYTG